MRQLDPIALGADIAAVVSLLGSASVGAVFADELRPMAGLFGLALLLATDVSRRSRQGPSQIRDCILPLIAALLVGATLVGALGAGLDGKATWGFWAAVIAVWLTAWRVVTALIAAGREGRLARTLVNIGVPLVFGATLLFLWEVIVRGTGVPSVILPAPSAIFARLASSVPTLAVDFVQTLHGVAAGYVIGCGAGFLVAVLMDRVPFLQRGLLPIGNLVSALPIVGVAPIMVMWFGFD